MSTPPSRPSTLTSSFSQLQLDSSPSESPDAAAGGRDRTCGAVTSFLVKQVSRVVANAMTMVADANGDHESSHDDPMSGVESDPNELSRVISSHDTATLAVSPESIIPVESHSLTQYPVPFSVTHLSANPQPSVTSPFPVQSPVSASAMTHLFATPVQSPLSASVMTHLFATPSPGPVTETRFTLVPNVSQLPSLVSMDGHSQRQLSAPRDLLDSSLDHQSSTGDGSESDSSTESFSWTPESFEQMRHGHMQPSAVGSSSVMSSRPTSVSDQMTGTFNDYNRKQSLNKFASSSSTPGRSFPNSSISVSHRLHGSGLGPPLPVDIMSLTDKQFLSNIDSFNAVIVRRCAVSVDEIDLMAHLPPYLVRVVKPLGVGDHIILLRDALSSSYAPLTLQCQCEQYACQYHIKCCCVDAECPWPELFHSGKFPHFRHMPAIDDRDSIYSRSSH